MPPKTVMSTARMSKAASTKMPRRKRMVCSFMGSFRLRFLRRDLAEPVAGLAVDELLHARVGAGLQLRGRAVEQELPLVRPQPAERVEHDDAVGDALHR